MAMEILAMENLAKEEMAIEKMAMEKLAMEKLEKYVNDHGNMAVVEKSIVLENGENVLLFHSVQLLAQ